MPERPLPNYGEKPAPKKPAPKKPAPKKPAPRAPSQSGLKIGEVSTVAIPAKYQALVAKAHAQTGLPESIIAAQLRLESGWNPNAVSPTGAKGIAQFEPGTWSGLHCAGSPFNPSDAITCYIKLIRQLITRFHGNVRDVLAAYNAGPGNLQAGYGYADEIMGTAGGGAAVSPGGVSYSNVTLPPLPSSSQDNWSDYIGQGRANINNAAKAMATRRDGVNATRISQGAHYIE